MADPPERVGARPVTTAGAPPAGRDGRPPGRAGCPDRAGSPDRAGGLDRDSGSAPARDADRGRARDRGSGTVHALTLTLVLGVLLLAVLLLAQAGIATHRAGKAADLAALAAADVARGLVAGDPCATAARVARRNGADLERCELVAPERVVVDVGTTVALEGPLARFGAARGVSRAGPPEGP